MIGQAAPILRPIGLVERLPPVFLYLRRRRDLPSPAQLEAIEAALAPGAIGRHLVFRGPSLHRRFGSLRTLVQRAEALGRETACRARYTALLQDVALDGETRAFFAEKMVRVVVRPATGRAEHSLASLWSADASFLGPWVGAARRLAWEGVDSALEVALGPDDPETLGRALEALEAAGARQIVFSCLHGRVWTRRAADSVAETVQGWVARLERRRSSGGFPIRILNIDEGVSAGLLTPALVVDEAGCVRWQGAQELKSSYRKMGAAFRFGLEAVRNPPRALEPLALRERIAQIYPVGKRSGAALAASLYMGLRLDRVFQLAGGRLKESQENRPFVGRLAEEPILQEPFLQRHLPGVRCVFLFVKTSCANDCVFCGHKTEQPETARAVLARLGPLPRSIRKLAIVGNEPLLHPDIAQIVRGCRERGYQQIEVMTSGGPLASPAALAELRAAGATSFALPLHGATKEVHDAVCGRKGAFDEVMRALANLRASPGVRVYVHANLCRRNIAELPRLERLVRDQWRLPFVILPLRPREGGKQLRYEALAPRYSELPGLGVRSLAGFPVCVMRRVQAQALLPPGQISDSTAAYVLHQEFVKPAVCGSCALSDRCNGTFSQHLEAYGPEMIEPIAAAEACGDA